MKRKLLAAGAVAMGAMGAMGAANTSAPRSDVEARLDALETINVTAQKVARVDDEALDAELDAILRAAARAEDESPR